MKNFERTPDPGRNSCYQLLRKNNPSPENFREILVAPYFFRENKQRKSVNFLAPQNTEKSQLGFILKDSQVLILDYSLGQNYLVERNPIQRGQVKGKYVTVPARQILRKGSG